MNQVSVTNRGEIWWLSVDDGKANVMSPELIAEINLALDEVDIKSGVVVFEGRPGYFSGGFDFRLIHNEKDRATQMSKDGWNLWLRLFNFPRPVIAAVTGHAIGFGAYLTTAFDYVFAVKGDYQIGFSEVANNIPLGNDLTFLRPITLRVPPPLQTEVILHARLFSPEQAKTHGLCHELTSQAELQPACEEKAKQLIALPNPAYADTKRGLRAECSNNIARAIETLVIP